jgi:hypothetical protein
MRRTKLAKSAAGFLNSLKEKTTPDKGFPSLLKSIEDDKRILCGTVRLFVRLCQNGTFVRQTNDYTELIFSVVCVANEWKSGCQL